MEGMTRNAVQKIIESGGVTLNGKTVKKNHRTAAGEVYEVEVPEPKEVDIIPENIPLDIAYEDDDLIVVNKARGMVVHPAPGHYTGTLVNALMYHCGSSLSGINGELRPGIVHRIDKDTSGLIVVAKNDYAHLSLAAQLKDHSMSRIYEAVVWGRFKADVGTVNAPIGRHHIDRKRMAVTDRNSREAVTHYKVLGRYRDYTHIQCRLETGRTHQIRVHMAYIGHPCLGDPVYGRQCPEKGLTGQCLHARQIWFVHPRIGMIMTINTELPDYFKDVLSRLGSEE
ncbi:MAG: RluA family pseudouridine synthase [Oscillospiraceae bacterium]|nr:RluA family pseudouridine synthase [Oscillospiraceae bacterium]